MHEIKSEQTFQRDTLNIDIISDRRFIKTNETFKACKVRLKTTGKGARRFTVPIDNVDMIKINDYFKDVDYMNKPNPRKLFQTVLFNVIYYTCHWGLENLEFMTLDHYKVVVEPDGTCYVIQDVDELDKNHCEDSTEMANDGKCMPIQVKICLSNIKHKATHIHYYSSNQFSIVTILFKPSIN